MKLRTKNETAALDAAIRAGIRAGKSVRQIAQATQIDGTYCYTIMRRRLKVVKVLLLPDERELIDKRRRS